LWSCFFQQDINKRLSLPVDLHLPEAFVAKQNASPTLEEPLSRASRRQSLSEIGFGRLETYTKLDRLGQVRFGFFFLGGELVLLFSFRGRTRPSSRADLG